MTLLGHVEGVMLVAFLNDLCDNWMVDILVLNMKGEY